MESGFPFVKKKWKPEVLDKWENYFQTFDSALLLEQDL